MLTELRIFNVVFFSNFVFCHYEISNVKQRLNAENLPDLSAKSWILAFLFLIQIVEYQKHLLKQSLNAF